MTHSWPRAAERWSAPCLPVSRLHRRTCIGCWPPFTPHQRPCRWCGNGRGQQTLEIGATDLDSSRLGARRPDHWLHGDLARADEPPDLVVPVADSHTAGSARTTVLAREPGHEGSRSTPKASPVVPIPVRRLAGSTSQGGTNTNHQDRDVMAITVTESGRHTAAECPAPRTGT